MAIAVIKDLRGGFGPARDQDPRPTCMAFAASDAHAAARDKWNLLSTEWAYYHALKRDGGTPHAGVTMNSMLTSIKIDGQPGEEGWPYIPALFTDISSWTPPACQPLYRRHCGPQKATFEEIVAHIDGDVPVLLTMSISSSFFKPRSDGVIDSMEAIEPKRVHALVAVGHGRFGKNPLILVRNSWGGDWGVEGHAWLADTYMRPRLLQAAIMGDDA